MQINFKYISKQLAAKNLGIEVYPLDTLLSKSSTVIGFDFETTGLDPFTLTPILLGLYFKDSEEYFLINLLIYNNYEIEEIIKHHSNSTWVAHNAKFDWKIIRHHYNVYLENVWCTMVSSQVIYNGADISHGYDDCVFRHFKVKIDKSARNLFINRDLTLPIILEELDYLYKDLIHLIPLYDRQKVLGASPRKNLIRCLELESNYLPVLGQMELNGINLDTDKWVRNFKSYEKEEIKLTDEFRLAFIQLAKLYDLSSVMDNDSRAKKSKNTLELFSFNESVSIKEIAKKLNPNSSTQFVKILRILGLRVASAGKDILKKELLHVTKPEVREFINSNIEIKKYRKLVSTYGMKFLKHVHPITHKIHSDYTQAFTSTGRLSSQNPNCQNIPSSKEIRECFIPDSEEYQLVTIDFSGQELRIAASYSQDQVILDSFSKGVDLHSYLAQSSYRIIYNDPDFIVSKKNNGELRDKHKAVLFGYIYAAGANRIADVLNIPLKVAHQVFNNLANNLKGLTAYQVIKKKEAVQNKLVVDGSKFNRIRQFNVWTSELVEDYKIEKEGANFPIQATAANMVKEAAIEIAHYVRKHNLDVQIKMKIHDEIVFQIPRERTDIADKLKEIMETVGSSYLIGVKMESTCQIADYWQK